MNRPKSIEIIRQRFQHVPLSKGVEEVPLQDEPCGQTANIDEATAPPQLAKLFAQRHAARERAFRPIPQPGQILRVSPASRDKGSLPPFNEPLAVLLDAPIADGKWRGWLVARDPEYATVWDLILGPEEDPRDPQCEVVQIWNPVTVTVAEADRVLAELSDERLAAARSMDNDCASKVLPAPIHDTRMGVHLARELSDGTGVVTGTPLAAGDDPRREYQEIYREAGIWVTQGLYPARPREPAPEPKPEPFDWLKRIFTGNDINRWKPAAASAAQLTVPWRFGLVLAFVVAAALVVISQAPRKPEFQVSIVRHSGGGAEFAIPGYRTVEVAVGSPVIMIKARDAELTASSVENQLKDSGGTVEVKRRDGEISINVAGVKKPSTTLFNLLGDEAAGLFKAPIVSIVIIQAR